MAYFQKRGKTWQARISWYDTTGKRHRKAKAGFSTKMAARKWANEAQVEVSKGIKVDDNISLYDYYSDWYHKFKEPKLRAYASKAWYKNVGKIIQNYFGQAKIIKITRFQYQGFLNEYAKDYSPASLKKTNGIIRQCVKSAILDGLIIKGFYSKYNLNWK